MNWDLPLPSTNHNTLVPSSWNLSCQVWNLSCDFQLFIAYAEDAGKSEEEIAAITEPELRLAFTATGVMIED